MKRKYQDSVYQPLDRGRLGLSVVEYERSHSTSPPCSKRVGVEELDEEQVFFSSFPSMSVMEAEDDRIGSIMDKPIRIKFWLPDGSALQQNFSVSSSVQVCSRILRILGYCMKMAF
jgi:hypothetical protein